MRSAMSRSPFPHGPPVKALTAVGIGEFDPLQHLPGEIEAEVAARMCKTVAKVEILQIVVLQSKCLTSRRIYAIIPVEP